MGPLELKDHDGCTLEFTVHPGPDGTPRIVADVTHPGGEQVLVCLRQRDAEKIRDYMNDFLVKCLIEDAALATQIFSQDELEELARKINARHPIIAKAEEIRETWKEGNLSREQVLAQFGNILDIPDDKEKK